ncbi:MAG: hypothetical protein GF411_02925 [Candidatus Lokiarchaeota archaeon]|nr:hypothetical protein [Candidatus Lokiarchaeota archaeon]
MSRKPNVQDPPKEKVDPKPESEDTPVKKTRKKRGRPKKETKETPKRYIIVDEENACMITAEENLAEAYASMKPDSDTHVQVYALGKEVTIKWQCVIEEKEG